MKGCLLSCPRSYQRTRPEAAFHGITQLDINAGEEPLELEGAQTLLPALYANEVFIPSACSGKGSCGHCKTTVTSGGGPVLPTEMPYLTRKEIRDSLPSSCLPGPGSLGGGTGLPRQAFLCGPPLMIEAAARVLTAKGFAPEEIFYDEF